MMLLVPGCSINSVQSSETAPIESTFSVSTITEDNAVYSYSTELFEYKDIKISYPQFTEMTDRRKEDELNAIIKDYALRGQFENPGKVPVETIFNENIEDISYKVALNTNEVISILFSEKGAGKYPGFDPKYYHDARGLTINMRALQVMNLTDFAPVDEVFKEKLLQSTNITTNFGEQVGEDDEYRSAIRHFLGSQTAFSSKMSQNKHDFCVTPTSIVAVVVAGHADGDYVLVEVPR